MHLNHTIVHVRDRDASARFLTEILGLPPAIPFGPFLVVELENGVSLDFIETDEPLWIEHYAFLVTDAEFDRVLARIQAGGVPHWADPARREAGRINHHFGGRGVYFAEPSNHLLEIITRPYTIR